MDRERLEELKERIKRLDNYDLPHTGAFKNRAYILNLIDALLEDDKPMMGIVKIEEAEEREECKLIAIRVPIKKIKHDWTPEEVKAIKESIIHWRDNVSRLKLADELGMEIVLPSFFAVWVAKVPLGEEKKQIATFSSKDCALCELFFSDCNNCPLSKISDKCTNDSSTYRKCSEAKGNQEIISSAENMVRVLEGLLE